MLRLAFIITLSLAYTAGAYCQNSADDQKKLADALRANFSAAGARIEKQLGPLFSQRAMHAHDTTSWYAAARPIPFGNGVVLMAYGKISFGNPPNINRIFRFVFVDNKTNKVTNDAGAEYGLPTSLPVTLNIHDRFLKITATNFNLERYVVRELDASGNETDSWKYIYQLTDADLRLYRNYIFARYNYIFKSDDLKNYYSKYSWYKPLMKNVDNLLTVEDKALIAAIQKLEAEFHAYKTMPAPGLPEKFTEAGKVMPATIAGFFFPPDKISQDDEYTASIPAIKTGGGYLLGLTRSSKPTAAGRVEERSHNYIFWKDGKTGEPVSIPMYPSQAGPISYPEVIIIHELFVHCVLPKGFDQTDNGNGHEYYVISGNDMFRVSNTPKAELNYFRNYLLARNGSSAPEVKALFGKFPWYKPIRSDITFDEFPNTEDRVLWYGLQRD